MAFTRPTLAGLIDRTKEDFRGGLGITTVLRRSFIYVTARAIAGLAHLLYGFLAFILEQAFPDTATGDYLEQWSNIWGVFRLEATFAEFDVILTGTNGTVVPINTIFQRDDGFEYLSFEEVTIAGGTATVKLVASTESGTNGNLEVGEKVSVQSPIAGLISEATVDAIVVEAVDTETDSSLQERLVDVIRQRPSGGAANDYIQWARSIAGVTRAWVLPENTGPGTVGVAIVNDLADPIEASPALIATVEDYIQTVRPVTANISVFTPTLVPIDLDISIKPNTAAVQAAIETELKDLIYRDSALQGAWKSASETYTGEILLSRLNEAISIAQGEEDHLINLVNGIAPANVTPGTNELLVLGDITWQALP